MFKRTVSLLMMMVFVLMIAGCGGAGKPASGTAEVEKPAPPPKPQIEILKDGSVIKGTSAEITINKVVLSYDVMPDNTGGFYTHYPADKGNVYIAVDVGVKNIQKQNLPCKSVMTIEADYNGGYKYNASPIVKDGSGDFTYANITDIKPLETRGMVYLIKCPEEVESSKNPLFLILILDGKKYQYNVR